jgi:CBS domain-containing protein
MSPRAASRLRTLGFERVRDYSGGKEDWLAFGLPREGASAAAPLAGDLARSDAPTCRLDDALAEIRRRLQRNGWDSCLVVTEDRVVLGRIGRRALRGSEARTAEEAMTEGPGTVRPSAAVADLLARMRERDLQAVPVTTPDGKLIGMLRREDAERAVAESDAADCGA